MQVRKESFPDIPAQGKLGKLALTLDMDQPGIFQFFHVVRQRGGRDGECLTHIGASSGLTACTLPKPFHYFHSARIAQRFEDRKPL